MRFRISNDNDDGGWSQLEQHGISIPRKWVDDAFVDDDFSIEARGDTVMECDAVLFVGQDVKADGNCLLRCFSQSGYLPYDYEEIRQALLYTARTTAPEFGKLAFERCFDDRSYKSYLETSLAVDGEWTGDFEMLLFLKTFGINIVSFTMSPFGLLCFNADQYVREVMHLPSLRQCSKTLYLFHHKHGEPLRGSSEGNHFCLLLPAKKNVHPITGNLMDPSRAFHPPKSREALPHDTSKFAGSGNENDPLEELDGADKESSVMKRKASETLSCRDAKRTVCSREASFPSQCHRQSLSQGSDFLRRRDLWFQSMDDIRRLSYYMYDDFF
jgi:hypothetical protein